MKVETIRETEDRVKRELVALKALLLSLGLLEKDFIKV